MYDDTVLASQLPAFFPSNIVTTNSGAAAASANWAALTAAIVAAALAGGGDVYVPAAPANQNIPISAPLTMLSGVHLKGVIPQLVYNTIPDSGLTTLAGSQGGTILAPTGAFPSISWNTAVLPAPASQTAFSQLALTNLSVENLGFLGGTYGIYAGNTNNPSVWYGRFLNLFCTGQTVCGINVTNYQHCLFDENYSFGCAWGQLHQIDVAAASLAPGNSRYGGLYNVNPVGSGTNAILSRSISFITTATTGGAADNNQFYFSRIQSNRFGGVTTTQAATMANATANIGVTDPTKFAVGLPVTFSATVNGFTVNKVYFVVSVVASNIQVALTYGGAAINATGSTAVNVVHQGFPCFEMIALAGSQQTNMVIDNLDVEGFGTCAALFQNCNGVNIQLSQVPGITQAPISVCYRGCANKFLLSPQSCSTDDDQGALGPTFFVGARFGTSVGYAGIGLHYDSGSNKSGLSLGSQFDSAGSWAITRDPATAGGFMAPRVEGLGEAPTKVVSGASFSVTNLNLCYLNTTASAVITLPSVVAANQGAWLSFFNNTGSSQTINTDGVQLYNNVAARTGLTLSDKASVHMKAMSLNGTFTWVIMGGSSAMSAGVISAPS